MALRGPACGAVHSLGCVGCAAVLVVERCCRHCSGVYRAFEYVAKTVVGTRARSLSRARSAR